QVASRESKQDLRLKTFHRRLSMEIIKRDKNRAVIIKENNKNAKLVIDVNTGEIIDFEENWSRTEIKEARRLLNT
ncbi:MAG: hypothetical protein AB1765_09785, partial [Candidatus Hydrogenedentota bacterium]